MGAAAEHAILSPSGKHRWGACSGSLVMEDGLPNEDSDFSAEGTAAHALAARAHTYRKPAAFFLGVAIQVGERVFIVDEEMADYVQQYLDETESRALGKELQIEQRLDMSDVYGVADQFGTGDAVIIDLPNRHLTVIDLKYGQGVKVFAEGNDQLLSYAAGAVSTYLLDGEIDNVTMVISQPRLHHLDEWTVGAEFLAEFATKAKVEAKVAMGILTDFRAGLLTMAQVEASLTPGDKTCRWCKVKATCPALSKFVSAEVIGAFEAIDDGTAPAMSPPTVPSDEEQLGRKMSCVQLVRDWCGAVEAEVYRKVTSGAQIIGSDGLAFKTVEGKAGHRAWTNKEVAKATLVELLGPTKAYEPATIITPSAADKVMNGRKKTKSEIWTDKVAPLVKQPRGKLSVVAGSDPRPAYSGEATIDEFEAIDELAQ